MSATTASPTTAELIRFILARLDEDDAALKRRSKTEQPVDDAGRIDSLVRLRADAVAKRRIVGTAQRLLVLRDQRFEKPVRDGAEEILRLLAAPYEGHPHFRGAWHTGQRR